MSTNGSWKPRPTERLRPTHTALGLLRVIATVGLRVDRHQIKAVAAKANQVPTALFVAVTVDGADISVTIAARD